ncbi:hypothetical protein AGMMS49928_29680 [Spirochaetia bacterium]|nr:hypothetical protein AGMMS49928_29680 [Spirochaetia bacterium]
MENCNCFEFDGAKYVENLQDQISRISESGGIIDFGGGFQVFVGPMEAKKLRKVKKVTIYTFNDLAELSKHL